MKLCTSRGWGEMCCNGPQVRGLGRGVTVGVTLSTERGVGAGLAVSDEVEVRRGLKPFRPGESGSEGRATVGATILMVTPF